jgi:prolipoprotein diacylglyceryltransferase
MIWKGGLGIWGAIAGGAVGAWLGCRKLGIPLRVFADVVAPGLAVAQAIGRFGNWFNQELYGTPTTLPWGLKIDPQFRPTDTLDQATYHPTFLYESLWCLGVAGVVLLVERKLRLGHGRAFALYGLLYVLGRGWIEMMRVDTANHILGLRLNVWTSILVGIAAVWYLATHRGGRETLVLGEDGKVVKVIDETAGAESEEVIEAGAPDDTDEAAETTARQSDDSAEADAAAPADADADDPADADADAPAPKSL